MIAQTAQSTQDIIPYRTRDASGNDIIGDVTGSAVIQGSDGNTVEVAAGGIPADVLDVLQRLTRQKNGA